MPKQTQLAIENFGPIGRVSVPFADITVLVGPQATGKSLFLQWLKLIIDHSRVLGTLGQNGFDVAGDRERFLGWFFGRDYATSVTRHTRVKFGTRRVSIDSLAKGRQRFEEHRVLYVPAHRALVMSTGWPIPFRSYDDDTPYVVREFGERIRTVLTAYGRDVVAPAGFRGEIRDRLSDTIFHGGEVRIESEGLGKQRLMLFHGKKVRLSTMEWTTGQREVLPLLVGLHWALPPGRAGRARGEHLRWIVVEEPELGLHPDGLLAVITLLLEAAHWGYRLVLSTHSQLVLDVLWAMQHLRGDPHGATKLLKILALPSTMHGFAQNVLKKSQSITYLRFADRKVESEDITALDPASENADVADWGGLLRHSSRIADVLSESR